MAESLVPAVIAFAISMVTTPLVRALSRRAGLVAAPKPDRWHQKPTAILGGVAIVVSVYATLILFLPWSQNKVIVLAASFFLFLAGLVDDLVHFKPYQKLAAQIMAATAVIYFGLTLPWTGSNLVNMAVTLFWLVGITNALNLLDNMDGLAAGVAAIASSFLAIHFHRNDQPAVTLMLVIVTAALLGFLIYNSNPASIFMGDCGSMFLGFFLASTPLLATPGTGGRSRTLLTVLAVPVLILFIPIFDTTFVTLIRKLSGRAASRGGRDHTSHRLVALGLSERNAVLMLYGFAIVSGALAVGVSRLELDVSLALIAGFTLLLSFVGIYLARVRVYDQEELPRVQQTAFVAFLVDVSYKRRIFEIFLDIVLITLAYYSAYAIQFGPISPSGDWQLFVRTLPLVIFVKLAAFLGVGVYKGLWKYVGIDTLIDFVKAIILGSAGSILILLFAFRFHGFSRVVFLLDALVLFVLVIASRFAFRVFRQILPTPHIRDGRRVLIYGAGDGGELLLREIVNNRELGYAPAGFVDDDTVKRGKVIHGLRVYGSDEFASILDGLEIAEVILSSGKFTEQRLHEIALACEHAGVTLRQMKLKIEPVER